MGDGHRHRKCSSCEQESRHQHDASISQEIPKIVARTTGNWGEGREQISQPWEEPNLLRPPARTCSLWNYEARNCSCVSHAVCGTLLQQPYKMIRLGLAGKKANSSRRVNQPHVVHTQPSICFAQKVLCQ